MKQQVDYLTLNNAKTLALHVSGIVLGCWRAERGACQHKVSRQGDCGQLVMPQNASARRGGRGPVQQSAVRSV